MGCAAAAALALAGMPVMAQEVPVVDYEDDGSGPPPGGFLEVPQTFRLGGRWTNTATNGTVGIGSQGDPVTLRWGIVPDGTPIPGGAVGGESANPSSLRSFLDAQFGPGPGGADLTQRPWFSLFSSSFDRWGQLAGLTYAFESADDASTLYVNSGGSLFAGAAGAVGVRGDVRIGGHLVDGQTGSNVLAYNFFPNTGDMVIDTGNSAFFAPAATNSLGTRNVIMHEHGHGIGINHLESNNSTHLMEPFVSTAFDGPQFDDILSAQRQYGDVYEKAGGNNTSLTATDLGTLTNTVTRSIGTQANDVPVAAADTDFISIDDDSDTDFLSFTVSSAGVVSLTLTPQGPTYNEGAQGGVQSVFSASALSDLTLALIGADGTSVLMSANLTGLGGTESILAFPLLTPGEYFTRITGAANQIQMYRLDVLSVVPEPASVTLMAGALGALTLLRRGRPA